MDHETTRRPNLKDRPVDQRRNAAHGGAASSPMDDGSATEGNATMRRVWSEPGGDRDAAGEAIERATTVQGDDLG
jgi:hypothetical protein